MGFVLGSRNRGGMKSRHDRNTFVFEPFTANLRNLLFPAKQSREGRSPQRHDCLRTYTANLPYEELVAGFYFALLGGPIIRWPAGDCISQINLRTLKTHCKD